MIDKLKMLRRKRKIIFRLRAQGFERWPDLNSEVKELATITSFSYDQILPLYENLNNDRDKTLKALQYCLAGGYTPCRFL